MNNFYLFIDIRWLDVLDILLVAYLIYRLYFVVRGTAAINIFVGILSIYVLWKVVEAFQMQMLSEILGQFIGVGVIALIIVFQQELRKFLLMLGNRDFIKRNRGNLFKKFFKDVEEDDIDLNSILKACETMSQHKIGALIVIGRESNLAMFVVGGQVIDATLNADLIVSMFQKESPLHDGAIIVQNNKIEMAQCVLSVSDNINMPKGTGLRHRSALGIAEQTDGIALIISEQTGSYSLAHDSNLFYNLTKNDFEKELKRLLHQKPIAQQEI
jgi:uncharacterized protein (TIGR00159 family)